MLVVTLSINGNNIPFATNYAIGIFILAIPQTEFTDILNRSQKSVYTDWMLNVSNVPNVTSDLYCGISYDDCRCLLVSTNDCLSNQQVKLVRILPLFLFVLQILLIAELFSSSGTYKYFFVYLLWIFAMFGFISILIIVYRKPCYYTGMILVLFCTGCLLFLMVCSALRRPYRR